MDRLARAIVLAASTLLVSADAPDPQQIRSIISGLLSASRETRSEALKKAKEFDGIPEQAIEPLISCVKLEIESLVVPDPLEHKEGEIVENVPLTGQEVSLVRLKASPGDYIGKEFILCGGISTDDYYNYGYRDANESHYSFRFFQADKSAGAVGNDSAHLYLARIIGRPLSERVIRTEERIKGSLLVRLRCTVRPERSKGNPEAILSQIEITDWQFLSKNNKGWGDWAFDGFTTALGLLRRAGPVAVKPLVKHIASDQDFQGDVPDAILRLGLSGVVAAMDPESRRLAYDGFYAAAREATTKKARDLASEMCTKVLAADAPARSEARP